MAYEVIFDTRSHNDVDEISNFHSDTILLKNFRASLGKQAEILETWPNIGTKTGGFRKIIILKRYVLLYRIEGDKVIIQRIFDGRINYNEKKEKK